MHTILFYDVVDDYVAKRAPFRAAHLELGRQAHARGELQLAGAFAEPADGAVLVFRGEWAGQGLAGKKMGHGNRWRLIRLSQDEDRRGRQASGLPSALSNCNSRRSCGYHPYLHSLRDGRCQICKHRPRGLFPAWFRLPGDGLPFPGSPGPEPVRGADQGYKDDQLARVAIGEHFSRSLLALNR